MIQSPLNYTGGKYRLLPQILPHFPKDMDVFVDLFCGGCNVGINVEANTVIYNDADRHLCSLYNTFQRLDKQTTFAWIYQIIERYELSLVSKNGYDYYGCESSRGVSEYNKEHFMRLRDDFNAVQNEDDYHYIMLYVVIVYAFNNQIRFNRKGEFNLPVGKRDFNKKMADKLSVFIDRIQTQNCMFTCKDFREFDISQLGSKDFVYVDPPYLITCATYNEQGGWNEENEGRLLDFLDMLSEKNIRFALSNVLTSKGKENKVLVKWLAGNRGKYCVIPLDYSYANANYQTKNRGFASEEVLIVNY
ncbi:MAG: DNA adenine methylase [Muribaculaceae bacterium]|nr:DNA adenine methylase [Roseburia sp.]MCM1432171.1 DNA adenine methylase [Muribaculaceae bacterium]MCM1492143.1 DNA adenine methylase [Muribaculaceae bacterium]